MVQEEGELSSDYQYKVYIEGDGRWERKKYKSCGSSMIPLARPTISLVAIFILTWNLFCMICKSGDRRTYRHHAWK